MKNNTCTGRAKESLNNCHHHCEHCIIYITVEGVKNHRILTLLSINIKNIELRLLFMFVL